MIRTRHKISWAIAILSLNESKRFTASSPALRYSFSPEPRIDFSAKLLLCISLMLLFISCSDDPKKALGQFYSYNGPEESLMDPLILAGEKVVPFVISSVKDKEMPKRRYAIGFLGNGSYSQAIPVLEEILKDTSEKDFIRGDALISIYQINALTAMKYAEQYKNEPGYHGNISREIISKTLTLPTRRSYSDAAAAKTLEP
jgi:hypothetical protein